MIKTLPTTMRAAVITSPGKLKVTAVECPTPKSGEVLIKVWKAALCGTDQRVLRGEKDIEVPIIGHEIVGEVVAIGSAVTTTELGQRVAIQTVIGCNDCPMCASDRQNLCENGFKAIGYAWNGGFAEYMIVPAEGVRQGVLIALPNDFSDELGTMIEPLSCCVNGMRYMPLEKMESLVVLGAGIIGVYNALLAKIHGVKNVILMNRSQPRLSLLESMNLPIDHLVNMADHDPLEWVKAHTDGRGVDGVVTAASDKSLIPLGMDMLKRGGHLQMFAGVSKHDPVLPIDVNKIHYRELNLHGANSSVRQDYLDTIAILQNNTVNWHSLITHRFGLSDFPAAVATQADRAANSLKIIIDPTR